MGEKATVGAGGDEGIGAGVGIGTATGAEVGIGAATGVETGIIVGVATKEEAGICGETCVILGREDMVCGKASAPPDALRASASEAKVFISY